MHRGVVQAGGALDAFLDAELSRYQLTADRLALVGFSQGTMMSLHVGLGRTQKPAAIIGFSGMFAAAEPSGSRRRRSAHSADPRRSGPDDPD